MVNAMDLELAGLIVASRSKFQLSDGRDRVSLAQLSSSFADFTDDFFLSSMPHAF